MIQFYNMKRISIWKWIGGTVLILFLGIVVFGLYLNSQWKPILTERIKEIVATSSDSLYTIDFADISVNIVSGNLSFKNIVFKPDTLVYQKMKVEGRAPRHLYRAESEGLTLSRVHPWKVYSGRGLEMNDLIINNPKIQIFFEDVHQTDTLEKETRTIYQHLSKYLKSVLVKNIFLKGVDFKYIDRSLMDPEVADIQNVSVTIRDLRIDSASQYDKSRFYYTKDIFVQINNHKLTTKDKMYDIGFDELTASTANGSVSLKGLKITPRYADMAFSKKFAVQKDRYSMVFDEILFSRIDYKNLNSRRQLKASALLVKGSKINIFLNREMPAPDLDKGRNYPQLALKRFRLNSLIDTIKIQNSEINYTEYNPATQSRGTVFFKRIEGTLTNVTNDSLALSRNNWCKASLSSFLMGEGLLKVKINFNLTDPDASFNYSGSMGQMNTKALNKVLRPLAMVEINSGKIAKAVFSVNANYRRSSGKLEFYYSDLKVGVLVKDEESIKLKKKSIVSFLANTLLISDNNPSPGQPLRIGYSNLVRRDQASFFNLMWKNIFEGVKASVGFTAARERELRESFDKMKGSETDRIERREKREERREKRDERRDSNR